MSQCSRAHVRRGQWEAAEASGDLTATTKHGAATNAVLTTSSCSTFDYKCLRVAPLVRIELLLLAWCNADRRVSVLNAIAFPRVAQPAPGSACPSRAGEPLHRSPLAAPPCARLRCRHRSRAVLCRAARTAVCAAGRASDDLYATLGVDKSADGVSVALGNRHRLASGNVASLAPVSHAPHSESVEERISQAGVEVPPGREQRGEAPQLLCIDNAFALTPVASSVTSRTQRSGSGPSRLRTPRCLTPLCALSTTGLGQVRTPYQTALCSLFSPYVSLRRRGWRVGRCTKWS